MNVTVEKLSPVLIELAVEIPQSRVSAEVERAFAEFAKTAKIRGFRPGKAPREVVAHMFGGQVTATVTQKLVDETLQRALSEKTITPLATLAIVPDKLDQKGAFSYRARFEVTPDIDDAKYEGFTVNKPSVAVDPAAVDEGVEQLRVEHATLRAPEPARPAKANDTIIFDLTLDLDGAPRPDAASNDVEAELGNGTLMRELDGALTGASTGDTRDVEVTFPDAHPKREFRGKKGVFHVKLKEIKERVLPQVDDEFAKDCGDYEDVAALRDAVEKGLKRQKNQAAEDAIAEQIVVELCRANPIPVPPSLVRQQFEVTQQELAAQARRMGQRFNLTEELRANLQADSEMKVRAGLVMATIAKKEGVMVNDEDIEKAYVELAEQTGKNVARVKADYREPKKREVLIGMILEDKILDIIEKKSTVVEA
ncbi:MAG: trigger factor [Polyangiaceae bacterium]|nr:trigger factor [Polyangiaceae bacterium]